jgi:hypothetical protein
LARKRCYQQPTIIAKGLNQFAETGGLGLLDVTQHEIPVCITWQAP